MEHQELQILYARIREGSHILKDMQYRYKWDFTRLCSVPFRILVEDHRSTKLFLSKKEAEIYLVDL